MASPTGKAGSTRASTGCSPPSMNKEIRDTFTHLQTADRASRTAKGNPPLDAFDHILYFLAFKPSTPENDPCPEDITAGLDVAPDFELGELQQWVKLQAEEGDDKQTPFLSITTDPLRAFNHALHLRHTSEGDIHLAIIDAWILGSDNTIECNKLRKLVGEAESDKFDTDIYVWQRISSDAIIGCWPWDHICQSFCNIFPPLVNPRYLDENGKRPLQALRDSLVLVTPKPSTPELVCVLLDFLGLASEHTSTKQLALIMLGWSRGKSQVDEYQSLEKWLKQSIAKELKGLEAPKELERLYYLDFRLYARSFRVGQKIKMILAPVGTESTERLMYKWDLNKVFKQHTFEEWIEKRFRIEEVAYQKACKRETPRHDVLPLEEWAKTLEYELAICQQREDELMASANNFSCLLEGLGFIVQPMPMDRRHESRRAVPVIVIDRAKRNVLPQSRKA